MSIEDQEDQKLQFNSFNTIKLRLFDDHLRDFLKRLFLAKLYIFATFLNVWFYMGYYFGILYGISGDGFAMFLYIVILSRFWTGALVLFYQSLTNKNSSNNT